MFYVLTLFDFEFFIMFFLEIYMFLLLFYSQFECLMFDITVVVNHRQVINVGFILFGSQYGGKRAWFGLGPVRVLRSTTSN